MTKAPIWDLHDLNLVLKLFKSRTTQKEINRILIADRKERGVWKGEKDLSNRISRLSPNSKHREREERIIRNRAGYNEVVKKIMKCLRINETGASKIYTERIYLSGIAPYDFYNANQRNLKTIRFYAPTECKAMIYIAFTSEDYDDGSDDPAISYEMNDETGELEEVKSPSENIDKEHIWTIKTPYNYQQVLNGLVTKGVLESYLSLKAGGEYIPIFLNTLILAEK